MKVLICYRRYQILLHQRMYSTTRFCRNYEHRIIALYKYSFFHSLTHLYASFVPVSGEFFGDSNSQYVHSNLRPVEILHIVCQSY